ncbi:hypothetical protein DYB28_007631 [Aphanomyces astaci]|uniref:MULE transposase domain-containing protein n=1 Tax=Aphanomyces astaci TaxID=112090 RepID=A0A9X8H2Y4_APHAT|nr:hypothetical protein DYB28_007631 [Aphanomyces astaci]
MHSYSYIGFTTLDVMNRYKTTCEDNPRRKILCHVDTTFSTNKSGYPVFVFGYSDMAGSFHVLCICITSQRTHDDVAWLLKSLKKEFQDQLNFAWEPRLLMGDADKAQYLGMTTAMDQQLPEIEYLMCFYHVIKKEAIDTSSSNQAYGRAVKYTTIPSSDAHDLCEYFMKQLVEQADRGGLTDDERKSLLGLKLSADKTPSGRSPTPRRKAVSTTRDHMDNLIEASERYMDEPAKAYAIRLQTILDEVDFPASKGVAMFKRGVRHARAESCLEHTDRELNSTV